MKKHSEIVKTWFTLLSTFLKVARESPQLSTIHLQRTATHKHSSPLENRTLAPHTPLLPLEFTGLVFLLE